MNKNNLKLLHSCVDMDSPEKLFNPSLQYLKFDFDRDTAIATNAKVIMQIFLNDCKNCHGIVYAHHRLIRMVIGMMKTGETVTFEDNSLLLESGVRFALDNQPRGEDVEPMVSPITDKLMDYYLNESEEYTFESDSDLSVITYDLATHDTFITEELISPLKKWGEADSYGVKVVPQQEHENGNISVGRATFFALDRDGEVRFTLVVNGIEYTKTH